MKIRFWRDRSCLNKIFFLIYKLNRIVFISIYFYFFPPFSIFLNFCLPFVFRNQYKAAWVTLGENAGVPGYEVTPEILRTANITQAEYDMFALIMEGERLSYDTEWSEGFEDIAKDLAIEGDEIVSTELEIVE